MKNIEDEKIKILRENIKLYLEQDEIKEKLSNYSDRDLALSQLKKHLMLLFKADINDIHKILDDLI